MKIILSVLLIFVAILTGRTQDITASLDKAQKAYDASSQQEARQELQQALIDLNVLIGNKVLALMPPTLGGLDISKTDDSVIGGTGFAGLLISRTYGANRDKRIEITLANDSPLMSTISSFLSNDMLSGLMASQTGQKRVMVSGYKGMLEKSEGDTDGSVQYTINVPIDNTLLTFESTGFNDEDEVLSLAQQINVDKIVPLIK